MYQLHDQLKLVFCTKLVEFLIPKAHYRIVVLKTFQGLSTMGVKKCALYYCFFINF